MQLADDDDDEGEEVTGKAEVLETESDARGCNDEPPSILRSLITLTDARWVTSRLVMELTITGAASFLPAVALDPNIRWPMTGPLSFSSSSSGDDVARSKVPADGGTRSSRFGRKATSAIEVGIRTVGLTGAEAARIWW